MVVDEEVDAPTVENTHPGGSRFDAAREEQRRTMTDIDHADGGEFGSRSFRKGDIGGTAGRSGRGEAKEDSMGESFKDEVRGRRRIRGVAFLLGLARQLSLRSTALLFHSVWLCS